MRYFISFVFGITLIALGVAAEGTPAMDTKIPHTWGWAMICAGVVLVAYAGRELRN